jgi:uncharacterized membrane-anchored protein
MMKNKKALIIALLFPIIVLGTLTAYRQYVFSHGDEVVLPISGYDPRDLLAGHYLTYRIDYGVDGICAAYSPQQTGFVCLAPKMFSYTEPENCSKLIRGVCNYGRFEAGIERYYVSDDKAKYLEEQVRAKAASIVLSVTPGGQAQVKDVLVNGRSWNRVD